MTEHLARAVRDAHPPSALRVAHFLGVLRDLLVVAVGIIVLIATPPSLQEFGADDAAVLAWALLPLVGGLLCVYGKLREQVTAEVVGSFTVAAGFLVWAYAVTQQPGATLQYLGAAGAFAVLALNKIIRGIIIATGVLREAP